MKRVLGWLLFPTLLVWGAGRDRKPAPLPAPSELNARVDLNAGWRIQSSAKLEQGGAAISTRGFDTSGWYAADMPSTVIAALVRNGVLADPYFGLNLRSYPGITGVVGDNLTGLPMPDDSPFAVSWWYRTEFQAPRRPVAGRRIWLNFDSINYRANIWLNGRLIAGSDQVVGMYRGFEFDITDALAPGANALAVEVFPPQVNDFTITFVDWNPLPPDKDMGVVRDVYLLTSGPVTMRNVQVSTALNAALDRAQLTVFADLTNAGAQDVSGTLEGAIGSIAVTKPVRLAAGESTRIALDPGAFPQLNIQNPPLWWPNGLGPQNLERLHLEFQVGGTISDRADVQFGIRQITSELDAKQHRLFRINGKPILIRGAGWTHDMMLQVDPEREENEIRYAVDMHLNTLRLEGKMWDEHFYDLADRYGILVMAGWCCCGYWEQTDSWAPGDYALAGELMRAQARRMRNHPSVFVFLYGSDVAPNAQAEQVYLNVLAQENWPNPALASAGDNVTPGGGHVGLKMRGPYAYVGPNYWLLDTDRGGAWGFATEISPGHAIPLLPSLQQMFPAADLWPPDDYWIDHEATPTYPNLDEYTAALEARYGPAAGLTDYVEKSQLMAYEGERAMFEAYGRNKYTATGVIQWMGNNAWPSIVWHLYDWYLRPGGGYFGTKKANEPLHVQYSYDDRSIVVVNSLYTSVPGYTVTASVFNLDLTQMYIGTVGVNIAPPDSATRVLTVPQIAGLSSTYFLRLELRDATGALSSSNFYWLSTRPDAYDWSNSNAWETPMTSFADLSGLQTLPPAQVTVSSTSDAAGGNRVEHVSVRNPSAQLAFFVHLTVLKGKDGGDIAPVYWEDNYFSLMPGEQRELTATYAANLLGGAQPYIQVDGWNVTGSN